ERGLALQAGVVEGDVDVGGDVGAVVPDEGAALLGAGPEGAGLLGAGVELVPGGDADAFLGGGLGVGGVGVVADVEGVVHRISGRDGGGAAALGGVVVEAFGAAEGVHAVELAVCDGGALVVVDAGGLDVALADEFRGPPPAVGEAGGGVALDL